LSDGWDWLNTSPSAGEYVNPYLTDTAGTVLDPIADPLAALGAAEAAVAALAVTGPIFLHAPIAVVNRAAAGLEQRGDILLTRTGAIVVADYGYPYDPDEDPVIYGTGPVQYWRGPIETDAVPGEVLDRDTNQIIVFADRPALALFDPQTLVSIAVTAP
jgi:hypothetical protein